MAKKGKNKIKKSEKNLSPSRESLKSEPKKPFIDSIFAYVPYLGLIICAFGCYQLFDLKFGMTGDDSSYVLYALYWINDGMFPTSKGPIYSILLAAMIKIFGYKTILLKAFSTVFLLGFCFFLFHVLKRIFSKGVTILIYLALCFNAYILFYGSMTFTEAFYLCVQFGFLLYFIKHFIEKDEVQLWKNKQNLINHLVLGLLVLFLMLSKNVAIITSGIVILYFLVFKRWKDAALHFGSIAILFGSYTLIKNSFIEDGFVIAGQKNSLLLKNPYNPADGMEDIPGYFNRLIGNIENYFSIHFMNHIGFRIGESTEVSLVLGLFIVLLLGVAIYFAFKSNRITFFIGMWAMIFSMFMFVILQTMWNEGRLILIITPTILISILFLVSHIEKNWVKKAPITLIVASIILLATSVHTFNSISDFSKVRSRNFSGDKLYGLEPQYKTYLAMSDWVVKNIDKDIKIGVRKGSMSVIHTGEFQFNGFTRSPNADTKLSDVVNVFKDNNVQYVIQDQIAGTMSNYLVLLNNNFPGSIAQVHSIKIDNSETKLFKVDLNKLNIN